MDNDSEKFIDLESYTPWIDFKILEDQDDGFLTQKSVIKKLFSKIRLFDWLFMLIMIIIIFVLGYLGFIEYFNLIDRRYSVFTILYNILQLFFLNISYEDQVPLKLVIASALAAFFTIYTATSAFFVIFEEKLEQIRLTLIKNHVVICGLGKKGSNLTKDFIEQNTPVVIIDQNKSNENQTELLNSHAIILQEDATNIEVLQKVNIERAQSVFITLGSDIENLSLTSKIINYCNNHNKLPQIYCHLISRNTLQFSKYHTDSNYTSKINFFNIYDIGARMFFTQYPLDLLVEPKKGNSEHTIVCIGFDKMTRALIPYIPKLYHTSLGLNFKVVIFSNKSTKIREYLHENQPLGELIEIEHFPMNLYDLKFRAGNLTYSGNTISSPRMIIISVGEDNENLDKLLLLTSKFEGSNIPMFINLSQYFELIDNVGFGMNKSIGKIRQFGAVSKICSIETVVRERINLIARQIHSYYLKKRISEGSNPDSSENMKDWEHLNIDLKTSNKSQADHIAVKLRAINCRMFDKMNEDKQEHTLSKDEIEQLARIEHKRWVIHRKLLGWTYGETKNVSEKTSPYFVEYDELSEEIKDYDRDAIRNIPTILDDLGIGITKVQ